MTISQPRCISCVVYGIYSNNGFYDNGVDLAGQAMCEGTLC